MARKKNQDVNKKKCYNIECVSICISICTDNVFSPFAVNMQCVVSFESLFLPCSIAHFHIDHCKTNKVLFNGFYHFFLFLFATCIQKKQISRSMKKQNMKRKTNTFVFLLLFFGQNGKKASLAKLCKKSIEFYLLSKWVYVERAFFLSKMLLLFV